MTSRWRGPGWRVVDGDAAQAAEVRDWIKSAIIRYGRPVDPGDAGLAVDELFVNAVLHGPRYGRVLIGYCLWPSGVRIVVADGGGAGQPHLRTGADLDEDGRGLRLVDNLAAQWGSFRLPGAQVVWSDLGQPLRAGHGEDWAWLRRVLSASQLSAPGPAAPTRPAMTPALLTTARAR
jgi:anti-sigma regulatory factor (Ser/Thr protein kinase)